MLKKTDQAVGFKNVSLKNKLNPEFRKAYNEIKEQGEKINYTKLVSTGPGKHKYNFNLFLDLKTSAESIYNGSLSLKAAKIKTRNMEEIRSKFKKRKI